MSVLSALNINSGNKLFNKILCKFDNRRVNVKNVDIKYAGKWPGVESGFATLSDSEELFNAFFLKYD